MVVPIVQKVTHRLVKKLFNKIGNLYYYQIKSKIFKNLISQKLYLSIKWLQKLNNGTFCSHVEDAKDYL